MTAALREETLISYVESATDILIDVARGRRESKFISYSELMDEMGGPGRGYIAQVLDEVSCREHEKKHPLLSALVVHKTDRQPGYGFWCIKVLPKWVKNGSDIEKKAFWRRECDRVWAHWATHNSQYT